MSLSLVVVALPMLDGGRVLGAVVVSRTPADIGQAVWGKRWELGVAGAALLALDDALFAERWPLAMRRALQRCARGGAVPAPIARPLVALTQRWTESHERALRAHLRRSERQADETFAFAGGTE